MKHVSSTAFVIIASTVALMLLSACSLSSEDDAPGDGSTESPYARWENGPSTDPSYFPIGVWLQNPSNAARYRAAGINVFVGLWQGPTEAQLSQLKQAGIGVVCRQNEVGLAQQDDSTIIAWMHDDEPDNAQPAAGGGYGPPVLPEVIVDDYEKFRAADPTRPVFLNLGQGVAWDEWYGRGVRTNHPEDYPEYVEGADIVSFDIYPAVHDHEDVAGRLEYVALGVERLRQWADDGQVVWNILEASRISNTAVKPTPHQIRAEVWMSLIHGSRGIVYFVHQFEPSFVEASLLADPVLLQAVTEINAQIHSLAPVLNSPDADDAVTVQVSDPDVPVAVLTKRHEGATYVFAVSLRDEPVDVTFVVKTDFVPGTVTVLDEDRVVTISDGAFHDHFDGYGVHLYRMDGRGD